MESRPAPTPDDAHAALRDLDDARRRLAAHIRSPWWYCLGAGACTASLFVGAGLLVGQPEGSSNESLAMSLIVCGAVLAPAVLLQALRRATGMALERYADGMATWNVVVFGLFGLGFALQQLAGLSGALFVAGAGAFVATVVRERSLDTRLRRRVLAGAGTRPGA